MFRRALRAVFGLTFILWPHLGAAATPVELGVAWLSGQPQSDGALAGEGASLATPFQARAEALATLRQLATAPTALADRIASDTSVTTEHFARRVIVLAPLGRDVSAALAALAARQNPEGGFGGASGYESSPLDTAYALLALKAASSTDSTAIGRAVTYLTSAQQVDGAFALDEQTSVFLTAYALQALNAHAQSYALTTPIQSARTWLVGQQASGAYGSVLANAVAALALTGATTDTSALAGIDAAIRGAQSANGSWGSDPYVTALALRALVALSGVLPPSTAGQVSGVVVDDSTGTAIGGAIVQASGPVNATANTDASGAFNLVGLAAGSYSLQVSKSGYASVALSVTVSSGAVANVGTIRLQAATTTAAIQGTVSDGTTGQALAGATVAVGGSTTTTTDSAGHYEIAGLIPGAVTIAVSKTGYQSITASATLVAGVTYTFSPSLYPAGQTPTDATLKGRVVDRATSQAIAGASVKVGTVTATTSASGDFNLAGLPAGSVTVEISAAGYVTASFSATLALGTNDAGAIALDRTPTSAKMSGKVSDAATALPIGGASVQVQGTALSTFTNSNGLYEIAGVTQTQFTLEFAAAGYQSKSVAVTLPSLADATVNATLDKTATSGIAIQRVGTNQAAYDPFQSIEIEVDVVNSRTQAADLVFAATILDPSGSPILEAASVAATVVPGAPQEVELESHVTSQPAGTYSILVRAYDLAGALQAEGSASFVLNSRAKLGGGITLDPPIAQAGTGQPVAIAANLVNYGNEPIAAGPVQLSITLANPDPSVGARATAEFLPGTKVGAPLNQPVGAGFDSQGNFYTVNKADRRVIKIAPDGQTTIVATLPGTLASPSLVVAPVDSVTDTAGNVHVLNSTSEIFKVAPDGTFTRISTGLTNQSAFDRDSAGSFFVLNLAGGAFSVAKVGPTGGVQSNVRADGLNAPRGIVRAADGSLYVANRQANTLSRVATDGTITTLTLTGAALSSPQGLAIDAGGNLYVANNSANNVVRVVVSGNNATGSVYSSTGLLLPADLQFDASGALYVTNQGNSTVAKIPPGGGAASVFAKSVVSQPQGMQYDSAGNLFIAGGSGALVKLDATDTVTSLATTLSSPRAVAVGASGEIFVANSGNGTITKTVGTTTTNFATALSSPYGLAFDGASTLYATEASFTANRVVAFNMAGQKTTVAVSLVTAPQAIRVAANGDRYILNTDSITKAPLTGSGSIFASSGFSAASFAFASDGGFHVQETNAIKRVSPTGVVSTFKSGLATLGNGIVVDASGSLFVADNLGKKVLRIDTAGTVTTHATLTDFPVAIIDDHAGGSYVALSAGHLVRVSAGGSVTAVTTTAISPAFTRIALDAVGGKIYGLSGSNLRSFDLASRALATVYTQASLGAIEFAGGQILVTSSATKELISVTPAGQATAILAGFTFPGAIAWDGSRLIFSDNTRLYALTPGGHPQVLASGAMRHMAWHAGTLYGTLQLGNGTAGDTVLAFRPGVDAIPQTWLTLVGTVSGLAIRGDGALTVATDNDGTITTYDAAKQLIASYAGISGPTGIAVDSAGIVFVSSQGNAQIVRIGATGKQASVFARSVSANALAFSTGGVLHATSGKLLSSFDANGVATLIGTSSDNGNVNGVAVTAGGTFVTDAGFSMVRSLAGADLVPFAAGLSNPKGLRVDSGGAVLIANSDNGTVARVVSGQVQIRATRLTQPLALAFASTGELLVGGNTGILYVTDAAGNPTELTNLTSLSGTSALNYLAVDGQGVIDGVVTLKHEVARIAYHPAGSGPVAGTVVHTATANFGGAGVAAPPVPVDFGTWVPPYAGDFRLGVRAVATNVAGEAVNQLHVGPSASAQMVAAKTSLAAGNSPVDVSVAVEGGDFVSAAKVDTSGLSLGIAEITPAYAMGADAQGNIYVSTGSSVLRRFAPGGTAATIYSPPAGQGTTIRGAIPVDDQQFAYIATGVGGKDIVRVSPAGVVEPFVSVGETIKSLARGSSDVIYALGSTKIFRVAQDRVVTEVATGPLSGFEVTLTIDGKDNLYVQATTDDVNVFRTDGTRANLMRRGANGEPSFESETLATIAGDCADNLFVLPGDWSALGQVGEEHTLVQVSSRTGQAVQVFDSSKINTQLVDMDSIVFDRFSSSLLIWNDIFRGAVYRIPVTCGATSADLHVVFPAAQAAAGFSVAPKAFLTRTDGSREYVWSLKDVTSSGRSVSFGTTLQGLVQGETRSVVQEAFLTFQNRFVPGAVTIPVKIPAISVDSMVDLAIATDALQYGASADVQGEVQLLNRDAFAPKTGTLIVEVTDSNGVRLASVVQQSVTIAAGSTLAVAAPFNTGTTITGTYRLKATLADPTTGMQMAAGSADFDIVAGTERLVSSVFTDSTAYDASATVAITGRVRNVTLNSIASNLSLALTVLGPGGASSSVGSAAIPVLVPQALKDSAFSLKLNAAAAGSYEIEQKLFEGASLVETRTTSFSVLSTVDSGTGLRGALAVTRRVNQGDDAGITATVANEGNAALTALPVTIRVANAQSGQAVQQWTSTIALAVGQTQDVARTWQTGTAAAGSYLVSATVTVGGREIALGQDTITVGALQPFTFAAQTGVSPGSVVESNTITISGIVVPASISIMGGEYRIGSGDWTSVSGTVSVGNTVTVRLTAAATFATTRTATLTVAGFPAPFAVTTLEPDTTPDPFSFAARSDVPLNAVVTSNTVTIAGINVPVAIRIVGGEYSVNGGAWTAVDGEVANGAQVAVRLAAASTNSTTRSATLTVGTASAAFQVTTVATTEDTTPDAFTFVAQTNAPVASTVTSSSVTVSGINTPVPISITGGEYSVNGGAYTAAAGTVGNGDVVTLRLLSSSNFGTKTTATLTISTVSAAFEVTTVTVAEVTRALSFTSETRLLLLVSCKNSQGAADPVCVGDRVAFLDALLTSFGVDHKIVTDADPFKVELRSGRYNTYWISGGAEKLANDLAEEVREAAFRGDSLIADGIHDDRNHLIDEVFGVNYGGKLTPSATTVVLTGTFLPQGSFAYSGEAIKADLVTGTKQAGFDAATGPAAIVTNGYGAGKGVLFAFDLAATLMAQPGSTLLKATLDQSIDYVVPASPTVFSGSAYVPFTLTLTNREPVAVDVEVIAALSGFTLVSSDPAATTSTANETRWNVTLPASGSVTIAWAYRAPTTSGIYTGTLTVNHLYGGSAYLVGTSPITVTVDTIETVLPQAIQELQALPLTVTAEMQALDRAVTDLQQASSAIATAQYESAITQLLAAVNELDAITSTSTATQQAKIDRVMQEAGRRWYEALPICPATPVCR